jgi:hypothetical protein
LFSARAELAQAKGENKNPLQTPKADEGILTWAVIQKDHKIILPPLQVKSLGAKHQGIFVSSPSRACSGEGLETKKSVATRSVVMLLAWAVT